MDGMGREGMSEDREVMRVIRSSRSLMDDALSDSLPQLPSGAQSPALGRAWETDPGGEISRTTPRM